MSQKLSFLFVNGVFRFTFPFYIFTYMVDQDDTNFVKSFYIRYILSSETQLLNYNLFLMYWFKREFFVIRPSSHRHLYFVLSLTFMLLVKSSSVIINVLLSLILKSSVNLTGFMIRTMNRYISLKKIGYVTGNVLSLLISCYTTCEKYTVCTFNEINLKLCVLLGHNVLNKVKVTTLLILNLRVPIYRLFMTSTLFPLSSSLFSYYKTIDYMYSSRSLFIFYYYFY